MRLEGENDNKNCDTKKNLTTNRLITFQLIFLFCRLIKQFSMLSKGKAKMLMIMK